MDRVPPLLPLRAHPLARPHVWEIIRAYGPAFRIAVDIAGGPGTGRDPAYTSALTRLADAGVGLLGFVDMGYATRPIAAVTADVNRWAGYPVSGLFLDRVPASPFTIGPVAIAVQAAHRAGLTDVILNPGVPPDPSYRELGTAICAFEGSWREYRQWSTAGAVAGDGHLIHAVPAAELDQAARLQLVRGAGFGVVTDLGAPDPYADLPAWCGNGPTAVAAAPAHVPAPAPATEHAPRHAPPLAATLVETFAPASPSQRGAASVGTWGTRRTNGS